MARLVLAAWRDRNPSANFWGAWALLCLHPESNDVEEGFKSACRAVEMSSTSALGYLGLAKAHVYLGNTEEACVAAERALTLNPCENDAAILLGDLLIKAGDGPRALAVLAQLATRPEASDEVLTAASEMLLNRHPDRIEQAMSWLTRAIALAPHKAEARALKAMGHVLTNELQTGRSELQLALALHPNHPEILYQLVRLATIQASELELKEAISLARRAVALSPAHWRVRLAWSDLLGQQGKNSEAFKVLNDALEIEPEAPELWLCLARQAALLGKGSVASEALNSAIALRADDSLVAAVSREVHLLLGNWKKALVCDNVEQPSKNNIASWRIEDKCSQEPIFVHVSSAQDLLLNVRYIKVLKQVNENVTLFLPAHLSFMKPIIRELSVSIGEKAQQQSGHHSLDIAALPHLLAERMDSLPGISCIGPSPVAVSEVLARRQLHSGSCWFIGLGFDELLPQLVRSARLANACVVTLTENAFKMREFENALSDELLIGIEDWEGVSAWMQVADLVVLSDDTLAYLAGAQGVSAHVVLGGLFDPHWGWESHQSIWFPSIDLHRITTAQDRRSALEAILSALGTTQKTSSQSGSPHG